MGWDLDMDMQTTTPHGHRHGRGVDGTWTVRHERARPARVAEATWPKGGRDGDANGTWKGGVDGRVRARYIMLNPLWQAFWCDVGTLENVVCKLVNGVCTVGGAVALLVEKIIVFVCGRCIQLQAMMSGAAIHNQQPT